MFISILDNYACLFYMFNFQMCIAMKCVSSPAVAPVDTCPFGDETVYASYTTLPVNGSYATCAALINATTATSRSPYYYCNSELATPCCQTCKRNEPLFCSLLNICTGDAERMRIFLNAYISMIFYDKLMKFFLFAILFS